MTAKVLLAGRAGDCELPKGWGFWIKGGLVVPYRCFRIFLTETR